MAIDVLPNLNQAPDLEEGRLEPGGRIEQMSWQNSHTSSPVADGDSMSRPGQMNGQDDDFARIKLSYSCHEKSRSSIPSSYQRLSTFVLKKIGKRKQRRLVHPMYRKHTPIDLPGASIYDILAHECPESLSDDAPDGKFGAIGFLSFTRLHHLSLHYFEVELTRELIGITGKTTDRKQILKVRRLLRDYSRAIQDYNFLCQHLQQPSQNQLTKFHTQLLPNLAEHIKCEQNAWDNGYVMLRTSHPWASALVGRVLAALLGGLALIVPMLIMSLNPSTTKSLVTASVFVVVAAITMALASSGSWRDVVGFTAAYAAVLVVFVGTSIPTRSRS